jgi:biopolymer transport protein ExbD
VKLTRNFSFNPVLINLVPLINVLFLVLIFFALSSRFVLQPGLAVTLPASTFSLAPQRNAQIVSVTSAPIPAIYHRDQKVELAELGKRLEAAKSRDRSLIIKADRDTPYALVVQIMNEALQHGFSVVLATDPKPQ